ncbi:PQQ-dependent oxidoreductase, gdhB family [Serinicoccus hydrothermalis]|uniref:PQQ-dependent oxidoreductase, gdhB family n=1 Tax=Serinicoccus hydrothermalis TaxID=1758689 RepID=A0A1B1N9D8_9MICO|nr:PQQ-dependent sugar dehydrogenase [Serinicoccus hydrothermalis]ANS77995.1 PQQ-dependent oxidoreductase, gdhB family [Serinicoccus hydrothermalis]
MRRQPARRPFLLPLCLAGVVVSGCSTAGSGGPAEGGEGETQQTLAAESAAAGSSGFVVEEVDQFAEPWAMAFLPGSEDLLVTERSGELHLRPADGGERIPVEGVPEVVHEGQGGLGDVLPGPDFAQDQVVYLSWVEAGDGGTGAVVGRARLVQDGGSAALEDLEVIWQQTPKVDGTGHFSHRLALDPDGEHLFVSSGDRQQMDPAQDTSNTLGTVVRLTLDGEAAPGNPLEDEGGVTAQIWSWGHRNPLGLEFGPDGTLWSSEMGPEGGDELNVVEAGGNYGWPEVSDGNHYDGGEIPDHAEGDGFVAPVTSWVPSISPGSLLIYSGEMFPQWQGDALLGALSGQALVRVDLEDGQAQGSETFDLGQRIRAVEQGPDGAVWLLEDAGSGRLLRLTPEEA